jgi:hypothetical protein
MEQQSEHIYYTLQVHSFDAPFSSVSILSTYAGAKPFS